jgi:hypothetical protein
MKANQCGCGRFVLAAWLLISGVAYAQGEIGTELKELPQQVKFEPGKVSLFADYENAVPGKPSVADPFGEGGPGKVERRFQVPIYLINDTEEELSLPHSNGDICVRQEVNEDGEWIRSERHAYSWYDGRFGRAELPAKHFYVVSALLHSSDDAEPRDVRYGFYLRPRDDRDLALTSNVGQARVSAESIIQAQYDRAAISVADLPKLIDLLAGRVEVEWLEYESPRSHAMYRLRDFPGDGKAIEAMEVLLEELTNAEKNTDGQRAEIDYIEALRVYAAIAPAEDALQVFRTMVDEGVVEKLGQTYSFFLRAAKDIKGLEKERREFFEQVLSRPKHPLFVGAANAWTVSKLVSREEMQARLKGWQSDDALPAKIRWAMRSLEGRMYPNSIFLSRCSQDLKTKLFQITIENMTNETIRFSYRHPLDILHVQFTTEEREPLPQKKVVAQTLAQAKDEELTDVVLGKGQIYTITGLNPWPMVDWSMVSPKPAYAEFIVTIPEFDEVGSGYTSMVGVGYFSQREFEPISALLKQPLISPDSTTSVTKRMPLTPGAPRG